MQYTMKIFDQKQKNYSLLVFYYMNIFMKDLEVLEMLY